MRWRRSRPSAKASRRRGVGKVLLLIGVLLIGLIFFIDWRVRPIITAVSSYQSKIIATKIINEAVNGELNAGQYTYSELVKLTYNPAGQVLAIESNMLGINKLKSAITEKINVALDGLSMRNLSISLGTMTGIQMLYGRGPKIDVKVSPGGYVDAKLISKFSEAGINQTLHQILLDITVNVAAIIPGYTTSVDVISNYTIAETVIVGTVPEGYTHVITESKDLVGDINDYSATPDINSNLNEKSK